MSRRASLAHDVQAIALGQRRRDPYANARELYRLRRLRDRLFGQGVFGEPAWDLLLDLFVADLEGKRVSVSSACIAAAVPPTTALRWIGQLEKRGLISRIADADDRRKTYLRLTRSTKKALEDLLSKLLLE